MTQELRVLLVEDSDRDAELVRAELTRAGLRCTFQTVDIEADFREALTAFRPQIVLSDFGMPRFNGLAALEIHRQLRVDAPFVFVSGTIGEEAAIEALKSGANDYVLKGNLVRLGPTVRRELQEAEVKRARKVAEAALRQAQVMAKLAHVITGPDGAFESWSDTLPSLVGLEPATMPRSTREWLTLLHPEDRARFRSTSVQAAATGTRANVGYRVLRDDGMWIYINQAIEPLDGQPDAEGRQRWFSTLQDVTEQKAAEQRIRRLNRVYAVLSGINNLIVRARTRGELFLEACRIAVDSGGFRMAWVGVVNPETARLDVIASRGADRRYLDAMPLALGDPGNDAVGLGGQAVRENKAVVVDDMTQDPRIRLAEMSRERDFHSLVMLPLQVSNKVVGVLALYASEIGFFDANEMKLLHELAGDISFALDHIGKLEQLDYLAYYDALTGLANRTLFLERLAQSTSVAVSQSRSLALCILDIERFKTINDTLGRQAGDALLKQFAERLLTFAGDPKLVARVGANEFAILTPAYLSEQSLVHTLEAARQQSDNAPYRIGDTELRLATKAGVATCPSDGTDAETLFRNAEAALKKAKAIGEPYLFYTDKMSARIAEQLTLENKLRQALERDEFVLHYQPKVELETRRIVGVEALIRWQSPELGLVPPGQFISLLEETGLILPVGVWAMRRAAQDHRRWVERGLMAPRIAVNVSPIQLRRRDFVEQVEQAIADGVSPTGIDLEITESRIMQDIQSNIEKLTKVRALGVNLAIDDFGTGYSSLSYLAKLPVQTLKIDRSFIITMLSEPDTMTLVSTIISLARSLELKVVAEGVDAEDQARMLRLLKCDEMQGYLFSKPVPFEQLTALLHAS
jgi:diguanylate cyclase (GGDEF)-like protein/PAS domain S-box-containing protein